MSQRRLIDPLYIYADPMRGAARGPAAAVLGAAFASFGPFATTIATTGFLGTAFGSFLVRAAIGLALNALAPKPRLPQQRGYQVTAFGSALDHQVIYGETRIAGARVFDSATGANNRFLHRVIAFAGHEVEGFTEVYLNDYKLTVNLSTGAVTSAQNSEETTNRYNNRVRIIARNGTDNQTAIPEMTNEIPDWTSAHRLRGIAYLYIRLRFDADVFPNGIPEITATVKGRKVFDPRTGTTAWSDNPALCLRDYLTSARFGMGATAGEIDDVLVAQAANVCEETVEGEDRYTMNGAFTTDAAPADILQNMLTSMGGLLWHAQGAWRMKPAYFTAPVLSITNDDLRSGLQIQTRAARRDNFNTVRGTFRGAESDWQVTDYKPVTDAAFVAADGGFETSIDLDLPFTSSHLTAQRIARIALQQQREQITVSGRFGLRAFQVQVGDTITITNDRLGWTDKEFEVVTWTFTLTDDLALEVVMTLRETSAAVFVPTPGAVFESNNTGLPSPFFVPGVGVNATVDTQIANENLTNFLLINITSDGGEFINQVEVQIKKVTDSEFVSVGFGPLGRFEVVDVEVGNYDIRARAINTLGVKGPFTTLQNFNVSGRITAPPQIKDLFADLHSGSVTLDWEPSPDPILSHYTVRHTVKESDAKWSDAYTVVDKVPRPASSVTVPVKPGTYLIRSFDKIGNASPNTLFVVVPKLALPIFDTVLTQQEHPSFTGSKSNVVVDNDELVIEERLPLANAILQAGARLEPEKTLFADTEIDGRPLGDITGSGTVDSADALSAAQYELGALTNQDEIDYITLVLLPFMEANQDLYGAYLPPFSGEYEFSNFIDTGAVRRFTARVDVDTRRRDFTAGLWDDLSGLFDSFEGSFDDLTEERNFSDTNVITYISTTEDDPSGTPEWTPYKKFKAGDFYARAARFKVELISKSQNVTPSIGQLTAIVEHD